MFEAVRTYPGYGMATLIYHNLLNLILWISDSDCTAKNT